MKLTIVTFIVPFLALARGQGRDCNIPDHSVCDDVTPNICDDDVLARDLCPHLCGICDSANAAPTDVIQENVICDEPDADDCTLEYCGTARERTACPHLCGHCEISTEGTTTLATTLATTEEILTTEGTTTLATTMILSTPEVVVESVICDEPDADDCILEDCGTARERTACPHLCGHCGDVIPPERTTVLSSTLIEDFTSTDSPTTDTTVTLGTTPSEVCEDLVDNPLICLTNDFCSDPYADEVCRKSCKLCGQ